MRTEPVRLIAIVVAILLAALPHLAAFRVPITPEQTEALNQFLPSFLVIIGGEVARTRVTPVQQP